MDFNAIWELIAPYVNIGTVATVIGVIIGIIVKVKSMMNDIKTNSDVTKLFQKALPSELVVSIKKLTETEMEALGANIREYCKTSIDTNTALLKELAKAMCAIKSVPDAIKEEISHYLSDYQPETTESIKLEMNTELMEVTAEKKTPTLYVD